MLDVCFDPSLGGMLIINRFNPKLGEPGRDVITLELYLDVGDLTDGVFSEKRKKAESLGVEILTEEQFLALIQNS